MAGEERLVRCETDERVRVIVLERPDRGNAIDDVMKRQLVDALRHAAEDDEIRGVLLTAVGADFSLGQDLEEFSQLNSDTVQTWLAEDRKLRDALRELTKPIVAAVQGRAKGEGFQMLLFADLIVASPDATFQESGINLGIPSINGAGTLWPVTSRAGLAAMILLAGALSAEDARRAGIVHRVVPAADLRKEAMALAKKLAGKDPGAVAADKAWFNKLTMAQYENTGAAATMTHARVFATGEPQRTMAEVLRREEGTRRGRAAVGGGDRTKEKEYREGCSTCE